MYACGVTSTQTHILPSGEGASPMERSRIYFQVDIGGIRQHKVQGRAGLLVQKLPGLVLGVYFKTISPAAT